MVDLWYLSPATFLLLILEINSAAPKLKDLSFEGGKFFPSKDQNAGGKIIAREYIY